MDVRIVVKHASGITEAEDATMDHLDQQAFIDHTDDYVWAPVDWFVLVYCEGVLASKVEIVLRQGTVDGRPVRLGGIGGVGTIPSLRRRGLSTAAMRRAAEFMNHPLQVEFGLLICETAMIPVYQKLGWQVIEGPLLFTQPGVDRVIFDEITMILPCLQKEWPGGMVDLCGLPW